MVTTQASQKCYLHKAHFLSTVQKILDNRRWLRQYYLNISTLFNWIAKKHQSKVYHPNMMPKTLTKVFILTTCTLLVSFATKKTLCHGNTPPQRFQNKYLMSTWAKKFCQALNNQANTFSSQNNRSQTYSRYCYRSSKMSPSVTKRSLKHISRTKTSRCISLTLVFQK